MQQMLASEKNKSSLLAVLIRTSCYWAVLLLLLSCNPVVPSQQFEGEQAADASECRPADVLQTYQTATSCINCHETIVKQFNESMHAQSFENPIVRAAFFNGLLPRAEKNSELAAEVSACIACHSPATFALKGGGLTALNDTMKDIPGVGCDFCHSITGFQGTEPEGGNYLAQPCARKLGPYPYKNDHHRAFSELHGKSEFCAVCHNRTNRYGLEIISTFSEWKKSSYAAKGIECQDCHMNRNGFLTGGEAVYDSGAVAHGTMINPADREKLFTHRFPGAHSQSQVMGAINLKLKGRQFRLRPGMEMVLYVDVDNSRSGHKLPTGSAELRLLYLDLVATVNGKAIHIPANSLNREKFDVAGKGKFDAAVLGQGIPAGSRLYRAVCVDPDGEQTLFSFDAREIVFDNRLSASEVRREFYTFMIPEDATQGFTLTARLYYLRYPGSLAEELGIEPAKPVELASSRQELVIRER